MRPINLLNKFGCKQHNAAANNFLGKIQQEVLTVNMFELQPLIAMQPAQQHVTKCRMLLTMHSDIDVQMLADAKEVLELFLPGSSICLLGLLSFVMRFVLQQPLNID